MWTFVAGQVWETVYSLLPDAPRTVPSSHTGWKAHAHTYVHGEGGLAGSFRIAHARSVAVAMETRGAGRARSSCGRGLGGRGLGLSEAQVAARRADGLPRWSRGFGLWRRV